MDTGECRRASAEVFIIKKYVLTAWGRSVNVA
jgi:hypothetical protein